MNIGDKLAEEFREVGHRLHRDNPQPSFTVAATASTQPEVPVSSFGTQIHRVAAIVENFGDQGIDILEAVASNPEMVALVVAGARIAGLPLQPGTITAAANGLQVVEATWAAAHAAGRQAEAQAQADGTGPQQVQAAQPQRVL